jgi:hypothetical protein
MWARKIFLGPHFSSAASRALADGRKIHRSVEFHAVPQQAVPS